MNEINEPTDMHGPVLIPGYTPGTAVMTARLEGGGHRVLDREPTASPRALDISGEFYAVWGLPNSSKAWKTHSYEHYPI